MKNRVLLVVAVSALALAGCIGNLGGIGRRHARARRPPGSGPAPGQPSRSAAAAAVRGRVARRPPPPR